MGSKTNKKVKISAYDVTEGKAVSEKSDRPFNYLNDGKKDTSNYLELKDTSDGQRHSRYVQVDLGDEYELNKIHLTRYYDDGRTYGPTVIELSKDENFKEKTQVFNSDKDGTVHNLGKGKDDLYTETAEGKEVTFEKTTARYIRVYVNGQANKKSSSDHIVELEAYGVKTNSETNKPITPDREINLTRLNELIEQAEKKAEFKEYITTNSWKLMENALDGAKTVKNNPISQEAVDEACKLLENGLEGLKADKSKLVQRLEDAKAYDGKQEFYTEDSWKSFSDALAAAKSEYKSENSTPETVKDAQEKLDAAIKGLKAKKVDKSQLEALIKEAEGKKEADYTADSWKVFADALANAENELKSDKSTPETVKTAQDKLSEAIKDLAPKKQVDKSKLEALIAEATGKVESQYTPESWTAFTTALGTANEVNGNKDATQETVDQACVNLRAGIDRLTAKADKTQLQALIDEAGNKNKDEYTEESWASFETALNDAKGVFANENASQEEVDDAKGKLEKAVNDLVKATGSEQKPTEKPDTKPEQNPTDKPGTTPEQKPSDKPEEKPTDKPDTTPEQKPTDKPVQKPTEKPSKNNGTNTGTSTHVGIFATTALASATAVLGLFGYKRRNKKK